MKLPAFLLPLIALLCIAMPPAHGEEAVTLKQRFVVGKRYEFGMKMTQTTTINIGGQEMDQTMNMAFKHSMNVSQHEDGKRKRVTMRYGRVAMEMNVAGQKMEFDSDKKDAHAGPLASIGGLVGKEFRMLLDENDHVLDVENFDEILKAFSSDPIAGKVMGQFLNKDSMKELVQGSMLRAMPDHPVKPGDSWPVTYGTKMGQMGSMKVEGTYTYNKPVELAGHVCALIGTVATLTMDMDFSKMAGGAAGGNAEVAEVIKKMGMKISDAKMIGSITFDPELGMARDMTMTTSMKMTMTLPPGTEPQNGDSKLVMPIKQSVSNTLLSVEDAK